MPTDRWIQLTAGSGGQTTPPPARLYCCHCRGDIDEHNHMVETNPESPVFNQWSCKDCFEGPGLSYLNVSEKYAELGPDKLGPPLPNRWL